MKRLIILAFCFFIPLGSPTGLLYCQTAEKETENWIDVLRNDPRLRVSVNFKFALRPTAEEVFDSLRKATGVPLSLAAQTEKGTATFGSTAVFNVPAWKVMQQLAATQVTDGKWEKSGDGYVLHGKAKEFGMAAESPEVAKANDAKKKVYEEAAAKAAKATADFSKFHPLGLDPKLRARLTVVEKQPKLSDVLARLGTCTGLNFDLADNLTHHDPDLGVVTLPNVAAYSVMELITDKDLDNGRWEKIDGGYRLEGVSRALRLPPGQFGLSWALAALGLVLLAAGAFAMYRGRGKKAAAAPSKPFIPSAARPLTPKQAI